MYILLISFLGALSEVRVCGRGMQLLIQNREELISISIYRGFNADRHPERIYKANLWRLFWAQFDVITQMHDYKGFFTDEMITTYTDRVDAFCNTVLELFGTEGITNYMHMLLDGHFTYCLRHHGRNLYRFQGNLYYFSYLCSI